MELSLGQKQLLGRWTDATADDSLARAGMYVCVQGILRASIPYGTINGILVKGDGFLEIRYAHLHTPPPPPFFVALLT